MVFLKGEVIIGMVLILIGIRMTYKCIRVRFTGNVEKLEGKVVDIEVKRSIKRGKSYFLIIEYFDGYNYISHRSTRGRGFNSKKVGDKVIVYRNTGSGEVLERREFYITLFYGALFMVTGLVSVFKGFYEKL